MKYLLIVGAVSAVKFLDGIAKDDFDLSEMNNGYKDYKAHEFDLPDRLLHVEKNGQQQGALSAEKTAKDEKSQQQLQQQKAPPQKQNETQRAN